MKIRFHQEVKCYFCGCRAVQTHHIYGGANRDLSEKYGCTARLCLEHHDKVHKSPDRSYMNTLRVECEKWFIKQYNTDIEGFRNIFMRNYLDDESNQ